MACQELSNKIKKILQPAASVNFVVIVVALLRLLKSGTSFVIAESTNTDSSADGKLKMWPLTIHQPVLNFSMPQNLKKLFPFS